MALTLDDFIKLNKDYTKGWDPTTRKASVTNTRTGQSISFDSGKGQEYGFGGGLDKDSNIIADPDKLIGSLGGGLQRDYTSPYSDKISSTLESLTTRQPFSYDPNKDQGLRTATDSAMQSINTEAARRGLVYSSSNKANLGESALKLVPQFEDRAFSRYQAEGSDLYNQLGALSGLENQSFGQFESGRNFGLSELSTRAGIDAQRASTALNEKQFGESVRQFDTTQKESVRQFDLQYGEQVRQFEANYGLNLRQQTFAEAQAAIQNAIAKGQLSISAGNLALSKARMFAENDPNSLDNQIRQAQLEGIKIGNQADIKALNSSTTIPTDLKPFTDSIEKQFMYKDIDGLPKVNEAGLTQYLKNLSTKNPDLAVQLGQIYGFVPAQTTTNTGGPVVKQNTVDNFSFNQMR